MGIFSNQSRGIWPLFSELYFSSERMMFDRSIDFILSILFCKRKERQVAFREELAGLSG